MTTLRLESTLFALSVFIASSNAQLYQTDRPGRAGAILAGCLFGAVVLITLLCIFYAYARRRARRIDRIAPYGASSLPEIASVGVFTHVPTGQSFRPLSGGCAESENHAMSNYETSTGAYRATQSRHCSKASAFSNPPGLEVYNPEYPPINAPMPPPPYQRRSSGVVYHAPGDVREDVACEPLNEPEEAHITRNHNPFLTSTS